MKPSQIDDTSKLITDLKTITQVWNHFEYKQLITWRVRFFISLIIAAVTYYVYPQAVWIWWIVLGLSAFSLITFAATRFFIRRKLKEAQQKLELLQKLEYQNMQSNHENHSQTPHH